MHTDYASYDLESQLFKLDRKFFVFDIFAGF